MSTFHAQHNDHVLAYYLNLWGLGTAFTDDTRPSPFQRHLGRGS